MDFLYLRSSNRRDRPPRAGADAGEFAAHSGMTIPDSREIVSRSSVAAVATDRANRVLTTNALARDLFGWSNEESLHGEEFFDLIDARDGFGNHLQGDAFDFHGMIARGESISGFELLVASASGNSPRTAVSVVVLFGGEVRADRVVYLLRPVLRRRRADEAIERILAGSPVPASASGRPPRANGGLTTRQCEVLRCVADGLGNHDIARTLGISVYTVRSHLREIFRKLGVHSRTQAVKAAFQRQML